MQLENFAAMYIRDYRKGIFFLAFMQKKIGFKHSRVTICEETE